MSELHLVLGGSGAIGAAVIKELQSRKIPVATVERTKNVDGVETRHADLRDLNGTSAVFNGVTHVYICIGLPYSLKVWRTDWPTIMRNIIDVAQKQSVKVIFFDNIYMYGPAPLKNPITEEHSQEPPSKKGKIRKEIADILLEAHKAGKVSALIARSADYYGPLAIHSPLYFTVVSRMLNGKNAQSTSNPSNLHSFTYTIDAAKAMVDLALNKNSYGQVWHLPTAKPMTEQELVNELSKIIGAPSKIDIIPKWMISIVGLFIPLLGETKEILYQTDSDYVFSSDKFMKQFPEFKITPYKEGLKTMVESFSVKPRKDL